MSTLREKSEINLKHFKIRKLNATKWKTKQEDKVVENLIHLVLVISFVCHLVNYQKPHRAQLTQRQHHMCSNVGVWVMMLGQTPHHRPPDTHSSLGEITASMLAKLHIHLPPWAKMKALHISTCAKTRRNMKQQQQNLVVHVKSSKKEIRCRWNVCINCIHICRKMLYAKCSEETIDMSRKLAMSLSTRYIKKTTPVSLKTV